MLADEDAQLPYGGRMNDRTPRRQPEPALAIADEDLPVDHHVEEVLAALSDLAALQSMHPDG
jgi:hypothetical protein